jgi:hypothetical protein
VRAEDRAKAEAEAQAQVEGNAGAEGEAECEAEAEEGEDFTAQSPQCDDEEGNDEHGSRDAPGREWMVDG